MKKISKTFTTKILPICFMEELPNGKSAESSRYSIDYNMCKYRIEIFETNNGLQFTITLLDLKFDYIIHSSKTVKHKLFGHIRKEIHKTHSFNLKKYKITHDHTFSHNAPFVKTKNNEIVVYPNNVAPYMKSLYSITIKPKELFLYFTKDHKRIEIHY